MPPKAPRKHSHGHAFSFLNARDRDGLVVFSRRSVLKAGLAGFAGLTFPALLRLRSETVATGAPVKRNKAVILLWMTGGPSHIDTWDVKPDMPSEIRGPFKSIPTKLPGVRICEHLPMTSRWMHKAAVVRSVNHKAGCHNCLPR